VARRTELTRSTSWPSLFSVTGAIYRRNTCLQSQHRRTRQCSQG